jgi:hypothetical protein
MVKKKAEIPALVFRGDFVGYNAIPSGTIYSGQLLKFTAASGVNLGGDYPPTISNEVPTLAAISSADVEASGVVNIQNGGIDYNIAGVAFGQAPLQATYQQLQMGRPLADATDVTQYLPTTTDTDVRRFAYIVESDDCELWLPFSGTQPEIGTWLTLSSGVDGCVSPAATTSGTILIGRVIGYKEDSTYSGVTVPAINKYVLTKLDIRI